MEVIIHKDGESPGGSHEFIQEFKEWDKYPTIEFTSERKGKTPEHYDFPDRHGIIVKDDLTHFVSIECYEVKTNIASNRTRKTSHSFQIRKQDLKHLKAFLDKIPTP